MHAVKRTKLFFPNKPDNNCSLPLCSYRARVSISAKCLFCWHM